MQERIVAIRCSQKPLFPGRVLIFPVGISTEYHADVEAKTGYPRKAGHSIKGCDRAIPKILIGRESDILSDKSNSYELLGKDIKIAG